MFMPNELFLVAPIAVLTIILLILKVNGGIVFFSVSVGSMLALKLGSEASLIGSTVIRNDTLDKNIVAAILVIAPIILSILFTRGTVKGGKVLINFVANLATAMLLMILLVPLLPEITNNFLVSNKFWAELEQLLPIILVVGVISSLVLFWTTKGDHHKSGKKHKS